MFKSDFKYYKSKVPPPDLSDVIDFNNLSSSAKNKVTVRHVSNKIEINSKDAFSTELKPISEWRIYELVNKPGLIFIPNPFTTVGQRYWVCKCLRDFTCKPQRLNIDKHENLEDGSNWWDLSANNKTLLTKLRWATLGYHHDWDTKVYTENDRSVFPKDLETLTSYIATLAGFPTFKAEAAIINFYLMNSTLSGHTDYSELNQSAPLISISFGQSAIFLIGGLTTEEKPMALFIHSGDIVIMSGQSRLHYHGVPKIFSAPSCPWSTDVALPLRHDNQKNIDNSDTIETEVPLKKRRTSIENEGTLNIVTCEYDQDLLVKCVEKRFWEPFENYLKASRINMNVRQVLHPGQEKIEIAEIM